MREAESTVIPHPQMPAPFDNALVLLPLAVVAWLAVVAVVVAACRAAGRFDDAIASQTLPRQYVADGPQQDLHVAP